MYIYWHFDLRGVGVMVDVGVRGFCVARGARGARGVMGGGGSAAGGSSSTKITSCESDSYPPHAATHKFQS